MGFERLCFVHEISFVDENVDARCANHEFFAWSTFAKTTGGYTGEAFHNPRLDVYKQTKFEVDGGFSLRLKIYALATYSAAETTFWLTTAPVFTSESLTRARTEMLQQHTRTASVSLVCPLHSLHPHNTATVRLDLTMVGKKMFVDKSVCQLTDTVAANWYEMVRLLHLQNLNGLSI